MRWCWCQFQCRNSFWNGKRNICKQKQKQHKQRLRKVFLFAAPSNKLCINGNDVQNKLHLNNKLLFTVIVHHYDWVAFHFSKRHTVSGCANGEYNSMKAINDGKSMKNSVTLDVETNFSSPVSSQRTHSILFYFIFLLRILIFFHCIFACIRRVAKHVPICKLCQSHL